MAELTLSTFSPFVPEAGIAWLSNIDLLEDGHITDWTIWVMAQHFMSNMIAAARNKQ